MTPSDEKVRAAIAEQAAGWFVAHQSGELAEEDKVAFLAWLKASPIHVKEYLGVARVAHHLPAAVREPQIPLETFLSQAAIGEDRVVPLQRPAPDAERRAVLHVPPRALAIAASLLALAIGVLWWAHDGELLGIPKTYRTAHGEQSVQRLPDGSVLRLDTDSEVTVRYSGKERLIELERGQALFEVVHESARRFRVSAGDAGAIAVGTQFDVYRKTSLIEFTVARGEIAVFSGEPSWLRGPGAVPTQVQRVGAGYQTRSEAGILSAQPVAVDLERTLGWLQHKLVFEHQPLGEVAAEFNRYGSVPVEIEDEALRALPVSGMFDAGDTESFVEFLQRLPGVTVERTPVQTRVIRTKTTT